MLGKTENSHILLLGLQNGTLATQHSNLAPGYSSKTNENIYMFTGKPVCKCSQRLYSCYPKTQNNPNVHELVNGSANCGISLQHTTTPPQKGINY